MSGTKISNSNHNQVIINITSPHVKMPGVQLLRPEEIKKLLEKEKNSQGNQKIEGKYIDIIKYDFIVRKEDIEAGVLGNTPENPKKSKDRPMSGVKKQRKKKETKMEKLEKTMANLKNKKPKENVKNEENDEKDVEDIEENNKNEEIEEKTEEPQNNAKKEKVKKTEKVQQNQEKEENQEQEENNVEENKEESFENVENNENGDEMPGNDEEEPYEEDADGENQEIEDEEEEIEENVEEKLEDEPEEEKTMTIDKKNTSFTPYQSNMANVLLLFINLKLTNVFKQRCFRICGQNWKKVRVLKSRNQQRRLKNDLI